MIIHFICRGNAFRSIIAEAYLKSLRLNDVHVLSSGTVANLHKISNIPTFHTTMTLLQRHGIQQFAKSHYGDQLEQGRINTNDVTICLNRVVYNECQPIITLPENPIVWNVSDFGEGGHITKSEQERMLYAEEVYREITKNIDTLVHALKLK